MDIIEQIERINEITTEAQVLNIIRQFFIVTKNFPNKNLVLNVIENFSQATYCARANEIQDLCCKITELISACDGDINKLCFQINWQSDHLAIKKNKRDTLK